MQNVCVPDESQSGSSLLISLFNNRHTLVLLLSQLHCTNSLCWGSARAICSVGMSLLETL